MTSTAPVTTTQSQETGGTYKTLTSPSTSPFPSPRFTREQALRWLQPCLRRHHHRHSYIIQHSILLRIFLYSCDTIVPSDVFAYCSLDQVECHACDCVDFIDFFLSIITKHKDNKVSGMKREECFQQIKKVAQSSEHVGNICWSLTKPVKL